MNSARTRSCKDFIRLGRKRKNFGWRRPVWLGSSALLLCSLPAFPQAPQSPQAPGTQVALGPDQPAPAHISATISGTVVDRSGAVIPGAHVKLTREDPSLNQETISDSDGQFYFGSLSAGHFELTIISTGFVTQSASGILHAGEDYVAGPVPLAVAASASTVRVTMTPTEIAEAEIKDEEKQRVLGVIPNFYVTYNPAAVPLHPRQKFELAWKSTIDPVNFGLTGAIAGIQQATNSFRGYGQGAQGYAKRYAASYTDSVTATFIGAAILPSLLKQDPRYFYKGTGSRRSRFFYAVANAVICKGDNGHWQANYSGLMGSLAAGGISNLYYPESDRDVTITFENALIGIGATAANNVLQEFVIRKFTKNAPTYTPAAPPPLTEPRVPEPANR